MHHKVLDGEVNLTIGGTMLTKDHATFLAASDPVGQWSILFVFKKTNANVYSIVRLMSPFQINVWIIICGILIVVKILILLTKKLAPKCRHFIIGGRQNRTPILNMWAVHTLNTLFVVRIKVVYTIFCKDKSLYCRMIPLKK